MRSATRVVDVPQLIQDRLLITVCIEVEIVVGRSGECYQANLYVVWTDCELLYEVCHELKLLVEVGLAHASRCVQYEHDVCLLRSTF